jgi:aspartyl protease family protein
VLIENGIRIVLFGVLSLSALSAAAQSYERGCSAEGCYAASSDVSARTVLQLDGRGAYAGRVTINGRTVRGIADTGATAVTMSARTADELGISYANARPVRMKTANGTATARAVMLRSVTVGNITIKEVEAIVTEADHPLLIGQSFLGRVKTTSNGEAMTLSKR